MKHTISTLALLRAHPQERYSIPKDDVWSLASGQLRSNWGQPTARVCLCCSKGSHEGCLLNNQLHSLFTNPEPRMCIASGNLFQYRMVRQRSWNQPTPHQYPTRTRQLNQPHTNAMCTRHCWKTCASTTMVSLKFPLQDPLQAVATVATTTLP